LAHERIIELYESNAAAWDRMRGRDLHERPWLDRFAEMLPAGSTILDIGCGMGEPVARYLIERGFQVTGVDSSPSLIAMCRDRFPGQDWIAADMRRLALGRRFDGILAWHSFFHLSPEDQRKMFPLFASHCAPGGALMFTSGTKQGESIGEWLGEPLYHGSLDPSEYRAVLACNGFEVIANEVRDPNCGSSTIWLAQMRPASGLDGSA
jgi:cyclopropane fatty-acyl-phospholipid synthase-like methyltransferase